MQIIVYIINIYYVVYVGRDIRIGSFYLRNKCHKLPYKNNIKNKEWDRL